jgi:hypothetical protein
VSDILDITTHAIFYWMTAAWVGVWAGVEATKQLTVAERWAVGVTVAALGPLTVWAAMTACAAALLAGIATAGYMAVVGLCDGYVRLWRRAFPDSPLPKARTVRR